MSGSELNKVVAAGVLYSNAVSLQFQWCGGELAHTETQKDSIFRVLNNIILLKVILDKVEIMKIKD